MDDTNRFFDKPILNSPYDCPALHWELDDSGQPTNRILEERRRVSFVTPIPKPKRRKGSRQQAELGLGESESGPGEDDEQYQLAQLINDIRREVDYWRSAPQSHWRVTPETARLLRHWRDHQFSDIQPFFCRSKQWRP